MAEISSTVAAVEAAAALLLRAPDEQVRAMVEAWAGEAPALQVMQQDFHDILCVPQSGRYVPLYEHVMRQARRAGRFWFFPPARYDGGRLVEGYYARCGFDRGRLDVHPILAAPHLPGDHLGFMLAFVAHMLHARARIAPEQRIVVERQLGAFVRHHLGDWVENCAALLEDRGGPYLAAVGCSVREAAALARKATARRVAA